MRSLCPGYLPHYWSWARLHARDRVAASPKQAVAMAVNAGMDMSMAPLDFSFHALLLEAVREGLAPRSRIDDAVRRILRVKIQSGIFEKPEPGAAWKREFDKPGFARDNLQMARESMYPREKLTLKAAIEELNGKPDTRYAAGTSFDTVTDLSAALKAATEAGVIIAALGEKAYCETPGNIGDLTLDEAQRTLVNELAKTGRPIVTVLIQGRPRVLRNIVPQSRAIVLGMTPGIEGGRALAEVLSGDVNPSGRPPFTYPSTPNGFTTYDHKPIEDTQDNPFWREFEFGHGLCYTTFAYSDLKLNNTRMRRGGGIEVSVTVGNSGAREGQEVVQLFVSDLYRGVSPPVKELKGFTKVTLKPGESRTVNFTLHERGLAFVGLDNRWAAEAGEFRVRIAGLTADFVLE